MLLNTRWTSTSWFRLSSQTEYEVCELKLLNREPWRMFCNKSKYVLSTSVSAGNARNSAPATPFYRTTTGSESTCDPEKEGP